MNLNFGNSGGLGGQRSGIGLAAGPNAGSSLFGAPGAGRQGGGPSPSAPPRMMPQMLPTG